MTFEKYLGIQEYRFSLDFNDYYFHKDYDKTILLNLKTKDSWKDIKNLNFETSLHEQLQLPIEIPNNFIKHYLLKITYDKHLIMTEYLINGKDQVGLASLYLRVPTEDVYLYYSKKDDNQMMNYACDLVTPEKFNLVNPK
jgi:hypothetical protein